MRLSVTTLLLLGLTNFAIAADDITIERVIGPEFPGRYKHPATIDELDNGDLYIAYYGGEGEYQGDTAVYGMRLVKGSDEWSKPEIIADTPNRSEGNAAIWQGPDGLVWLFYVTNYGPTWSSARVKYKISKDGAKTWSDSYMLAFDEGSMARGKPIVLSNGNYLLPLYHETGEDRERTASDTCSYFMIYDPEEKTWSETNRIYCDMGNLQAEPAVVEDDYVVTYIRRGGGFGPLKEGVAFRSESRDGGKTWSTPAERTEFRNPNSALEFIGLENGHLALVYNDNNQGKRMPLTVAISTDKDKTYPHRRDIYNEPGDTAAYPEGFQAKDGKIHIVFTSGGRTIINHVSFEESAILGHSKDE